MQSCGQPLLCVLWRCCGDSFAINLCSGLLCITDAMHVLPAPCGLGSGLLAHVLCAACAAPSHHWWGDRLFCDQAAAECLRSCRPAHIVDLCCAKRGFRSGGSCVLCMAVLPLSLLWAAPLTWCLLGRRPFVGVCLQNSMSRRHALLRSECTTLAG